MAIYFKVYLFPESLLVNAKPSGFVPQKYGICFLTHRLIFLNLNYFKLLIYFS